MIFKYKDFDELQADYNSKLVVLANSSHYHTAESYADAMDLLRYLYGLDAKLTKRYERTRYKLSKKAYKKEFGFFARIKRALGFAPKIGETRADASEEHIEQANAEKLEEIDQMRMDQQKLQQQLTQTQQQLEQAKHYIQQQRLTQQVTNDMAQENC